MLGCIRLMEIKWKLLHENRVYIADLRGQALLILSKLVQATQRKLPPLHFALLATLSVAAGPPAAKKKSAREGA